MPITILNPQPATPRTFAPAIVRSDSDSESDGGGVDIHGDVNMEDADGQDITEVLTPGTVITSDPKWMRYGLSHPWD